MSERISIADLRARANMNRQNESWGTSHAGEYEQEMYYLAGTVLALLEAVEAAQAATQIAPKYQAGCDCPTCAPLREALARFDFVGA